MFARQLNQIRLDVSITPRGPLLIRSGRKGADPTRPDLEAVRTSFGGRSSVYLPGSSLKGVIRSQAERLLLSEGVKVTPTFNSPKVRGFDQKTPGPKAYAASSPLGRTFGNLFVKGHVAVSDCTPGGRAPQGSEKRAAEVAAANATEQRNGVGIDRLLGSAFRGALFDQEVVVRGRFDGRIFLRNAQLYQLALLLLVLRDLDEGFVQIGSGTTRGNGWVQAEVREIAIDTRHGAAAAGKLAGAGALSLGGTEGYDLFPGDEIELPADWTTAPGAVWDRITVPGCQVEVLGEALVGGPWLRFLDQAKRKDRWPL